MNGEVSSPLSPSGIRGICPQGWHLPSNLEWRELIDIIGVWNQVDAMKTTYAWLDPNNPFIQGNGSNISGFSAYPAGWYGIATYSFPTFNSHKYHAYFWSCTESNGNNAYTSSICSAATIIQISVSQKQQGMTCRCVKD